MASIIACCWLHLCIEDEALDALSSLVFREREMQLILSHPDGTSQREKEIFRFRFNEGSLLIIVLKRNGIDVEMYM